MDLKGEPCGPVERLGVNLYAVFCVDKSDKLPKCFLFTGEGAICGVRTFQDKFGKIVTAHPNSWFVFLSADNPGRIAKNIAIAGFADGNVRALDLTTGIELAKFKTGQNVQIPPIQVASDEVFVVEDLDLDTISETTPEGITKAHHLRLQKSREKALQELHH